MMQLDGSYATGTLIALSKRTFDTDDFVEILAAKRRMAQGRFGAIRISRKDAFDFTIIGAYPPPSPGKVRPEFFAARDEIRDAFGTGALRPLEALPFCFLTRTRT